MKYILMFAGTVDEQEQWDKLRLIVETAEEVWGD